MERGGEKCLEVDLSGKSIKMSCFHFAFSENESMEINTQGPY